MMRDGNAAEHVLVTFLPATTGRHPAPGRAECSCGAGIESYGLTKRDAQEWLRRHPSEQTSANVSGGDGEDPERDPLDDIEPFDSARHSGPVTEENSALWQRLTDEDLPEFPRR